jgi:tetratricopeptide (TPR) repeat protein
MMDLRPWDYWTRDNRPYPGTVEIATTLESVFKRNPDHPGALHFWIHLWEATTTPERAEAQADRLLPLVPGAGHLVHMPGHIYQRVGRYADVVKANQLAAAADEDYIVQCRAQGIYPLGYYPHNLHFLWAGATMAGQGKLALDAARKTASKIPRDALRDLPFLQGFLAVPYWAMVRFGKWSEILAEAAPPHDSLFMRGVWRYARATALTRLGKLDEAARELEELRKIVADPELSNSPASFSTNTAEAILRIAPEVVAGEIEAERGNYDRALLHLEKAVRLEDALVYTEPADWHMPVRHVLGAVLMKAGRPLEAEVVYWEDLRRNPENGWALFGLAQALRAQGKTPDAEMAEERFRKVWSQADVKLASSRM